MEVGVDPRRGGDKRPVDSKNTITIRSSQLFLGGRGEKAER